MVAYKVHQSSRLSKQVAAKALKGQDTADSSWAVAAGSQRVEHSNFRAVRHDITIDKTDLETGVRKK